METAIESNYFQHLQLYLSQMPVLQPLQSNLQKGEYIPTIGLTTLEFLQLKHAAPTQSITLSPR